MHLVADLVEFIKEQDLLVGEFVQPLAVEQDAFPHPGNPVADVQEFFQLFGVLGDQETAFRVGEQECQLFRAVGRVDARDNSAHALDAEIGVDPFLVVFRENRDHLAPFEPERGKAEADCPRGFQIVRPGMALPDAQHLLPVGGAWPERPATFEEQFGQRVAAIDDMGRGAVRALRRLAGPLRRGAHGRVYDRHVFLRFQRRSASGPACRAPR